jgi:hypothetical protein
MEFNVTFADETVDVMYNPDLSVATPFKEFVNSLPELFPLRFASREAAQQVNKIKRHGIIQIAINSVGYLHLRVFDGTDRCWFDNLNFPSPSRYFLHVTVKSIYHYRRRAYMSVISTLLNLTFDLNAYDVMAYFTSQFTDNMVLVDKLLLSRYPTFSSEIS